jgi:4-oxalocrotonate tautomerase
MREEELMPLVRISLRRGTTPEYHLYKRITELLSQSPGVRPQDVVINLVETAWENWSFGNGAAHYLDV